MLSFSSRGHLTSFNADSFQQVICCADHWELVLLSLSTQFIYFKNTHEFEEGPFRAD